MGGQALESEKPRGQIFYVKAGTNKIYGLDEKGDVGKHLWVPDCEDPPPKYMLDSVRERGIELPVKVIKINGVAFITKGRTREKAARWLNEKEGMNILVPTMIEEKGQTQGEMMASILGENLNRKKLSPPVVIESVAYYIKFNGSDEESLKPLMVETHLDKRRLEKLMKVRESPVAYPALKKKEIDIEVAIAVAEMPPEKQEEKLKELKEAAHANGGKVTVEAARAAKVGKHARPATNKVKRFLAVVQARNVFDPASMATIEWLAGLGSVKNLPPVLQECWEVVVKNEDKKILKEAKKAAKKSAPKKKKRGKK